MDDGRASSYPILSCRLSKLAANPVPLGAAHMIPTSAFGADTKYPWRTEVKLLPSSEHKLSIQLFFRITRHQTGAVCDRSGMVDQSENPRVKTTLAWRWPS